MTRQPDKSHFLDAQPGKPQWVMIFRDWIIWLDITACEKIVGLAPKMTAVFCLAPVQHGPLTGPQGITHLPHHLIPLYRKDSATHTVLNCSSTDVPGCRLWEMRCFSLPSYASLLLGVRTSETKQNGKDGQEGSMDIG